MRLLRMQVFKAFSIVVEMQKLYEVHMLWEKCEFQKEVFPNQLQWVGGGGGGGNAPKASPWSRVEVYAHGAGTHTHTQSARVIRGVLPTDVMGDHFCACGEQAPVPHTHRHTHCQGAACLPRVSIHLKGLNINGINAVSLPSAIIKHSV